MEEKKYGVCDLVFLMDIAGDMRDCIEAVKNNIRLFFDSVASEEENLYPVKDWRAKVVGFRDYEEDGPEDWLIDYPFTRDVSELEKELSNIHAYSGGGGDPFVSFLDASYRVLMMEETDPHQEPDPLKWRHKDDAARFIVVFTDSPYRPLMAIPEAVGLDVDTINEIMEQKRIFLVLFAPDDACYYPLADRPNTEFITAEGEALASITYISNGFSLVMKQLSKLFRHSCMISLVPESV